MSPYGIDSQPTGSFDPQPDRGWSLLLGRVGGLPISVSYSVFIAMGLLVALVALLRHREGDADLPVITAVAVTAWIFGWIVQSLTYLWLHLRTQARSSLLSIGLIGVELSYPLHRPRPWTALQNLCAAVLSMSVLVLFAAACFAIHLWKFDWFGWQVSQWWGELSRPGMGLDSPSTCYLAAAWMFILQTACQLFPLPRHQGRSALFSLGWILASHHGEAGQVRFVRRSLRVIAAMTMIAAAWALVSGGQAYLPSWLMLAVVAMMLLISSGSDDVQLWVQSLYVAQNDPAERYLQTSVDHEPFDAMWYGIDDQEVNRSSRAGTPTPGPGPFARATSRFQMFLRRRKLRTMMHREQEEARDAEGLDAVLQKVSQSGMDSLTDQERKLLQRVSKTLQDRD